MSFLNPMDMAVNAFLEGKGKDLVNGKIGRYARVVRLYRKDGRYLAEVQLKGSSEVLAVTMDSLAVNENCSSAKLGRFHANMPWLENLLQDYASGREIPIPEGPARLVIMPLKKFL